MSVKTPNTDDVFQRFVDKTPAKKLEKKFGKKNVKFEKGLISAAESVQNVDKSACFFFRSKVVQFSDTPTKYKESKLIQSKKLQKVKFYDFHGKKVDPEKWKGDDEVPMFQSIEAVKCTGKGCTQGKILCSNCKGSGQVTCGKCKGTGSYQCKACAGKGTIGLKVDVVNEKGEKTKKTVTVRCKNCFGEGKIFCVDCVGTGRVTCKKCKGEKHTFCKTCMGEGSLYKYRIEPVPFAAYSIR
ncbi:MAG: hypothetical protein ACTSRW_14705 [Candidatus Helarchaeota archaeon]